MNKIVKTLLPLLLCSNVAIADCGCDAEKGVSVKLSGSFDFSSAAISDSGPKDRKAVSVNKDHFGFYSLAKLTLTAENRIDDNTAYGANIAVVTSNRNARNAPSEFYFESAAGKLELGSGKSAVSKMKITGGSSAVASKGAWDMWVKADVRSNNITYFSNMGNFLDTKTRNLNSIEYSRKISYFSPLWSGFRFGVSYIPDTTNAGGSTVNHAERHVNNYMQDGYNFDIKDGLGWAVSYENQFADDFTYKIALVGERGKVVPHLNNAAKEKPGARWKNLNTYTLGGKVQYGEWDISAAYADYMKSLTSGDIDPKNRRDIKLYSFGIARHWGDLGMSILHFSSNAKKNRVNATTFGVDYKYAPGLLPYAEITSYNTNGSYLQNNTYVSDKYNGTFFVAGLKLEF